MAGALAIGSSLFTLSSSRGRQAKGEGHPRYGGPDQRWDLEPGRSTSWDGSLLFK